MPPHNTPPPEKNPGFLNNKRDSNTLAYYNPHE